MDRNNKRMRDAAERAEAFMGQAARFDPSDPLEDEIADSFANLDMEMIERFADIGDMDAALDALDDEELERMLLQTRVRKERAFAKRAELQAQIISGELIPVKDVEAGRIARVTAARAILQSIPGRVAGRLASVTSEHVIAEILREAIEAALKVLSGGKVSDSGAT